MTKQYEPFNIRTEDGGWETLNLAEEPTERLEDLRLDAGLHGDYDAVDAIDRVFAARY